VHGVEFVEEELSHLPILPASPDEGDQACWLGVREFGSAVVSLSTSSRCSHHSSQATMADAASIRMLRKAI
jgi:hypothetical protein